MLQRSPGMDGTMPSFTDDQGLPFHGYHLFHPVWCITSRMNDSKDRFSITQLAPLFFPWNLCNLCPFAL
jgi:hypothetical protein